MCKASLVKQVLTRLNVAAARTELTSMISSFQLHAELDDITLTTTIAVTLIVTSLVLSAGRNAVVIIPKTMVHAIPCTVLVFLFLIQQRNYFVDMQGRASLCLSKPRQGPLALPASTPLLSRPLCLVT